MRTLLLIVFLPSLAFAQAARINEIYSPNNRNSRAMQVEAAIAVAQAEHGVIPAAAAAEIVRSLASPMLANWED